MANGNTFSPMGSILRGSPAPPGDKVVALFLLRGGSLAAWADANGYSRPYISGVVHGHRLSMPVWQKLAKHLGVEVDDLLCSQAKAS